MRRFAVLVIALIPSLHVVAATLSDPKIVPITTLPNEKEVEFEREVTGLNIGREAKIFADNDHVFNKWKRLYIEPVEGLPMARDDSEEVKKIAKCVKVKDFPKDSVKTVSVRMLNSTRVIELRYPIEYECKFDMQEIEALVRYEATWVG